MDQKMTTDTQANSAPQSEGEDRLTIKNYVLSEKEELIIKLWNEGKTASQIGAVLNVSRNVIIGKIWRMRRKGVETSAHQRPKSSAPRVRKPREPKQQSLGMLFKLPKPRPLPPKSEAPVANAKNINFWKLKNDSCRYVVNDGRPENFIFCGAPQERGPYCEAHALICYVPPKIPEREYLKSNSRFKLRS